MTGSATASCPGSTSTSACSHSPRTPATVAGADEVPRDLRQQPRRVLHGARRGLKRRRTAALTVRSADGLSTPRAARARHRALGSWSSGTPAASSKTCKPLWRTPGSDVRGRTSPTRSAAAAWSYFRDQVFPVLTPLAVDPAHPFPYISGLSLNLAVIVRDPDERRPNASPGSRCPTTCRGSSVVRRPRAESAFLPLEELIAAHLAMLFPGMEVDRAPPVPGHPQRRPRGRGGPRRGPAAGAGAGAGRAAGSGRAVRLEVSRHDRDARCSTLLVSELDVDPDDVLRRARPARPLRPRGSSTTWTGRT